jgi:hypothetical protein
MKCGLLLKFKMLFNIYRILNLNTLLVNSNNISILMFVTNSSNIFTQILHILQHMTGCESKL